MVKMILLQKMDMLFCGMQYSIGSIACSQQTQPSYYFRLLFSCRLVLIKLEQRGEI